MSENYGHHTLVQPGGGHNTKWHAQKYEFTRRSRKRGLFYVRVGDFELPKRRHYIGNSDKTRAADGIQASIHIWQGPTFTDQILVESVTVVNAEPR